MSNVRLIDRVTLAALKFGIAVPLLYFGVQLIAANFCPGYSFLTNDASTLGSDRSTFPLLFNTGVMIAGLSKIIAAIGFGLSLRRLGANTWFAALVFLALAQSGLASIWAGYFSAPDPKHNIGILGAIGLLMLPPLLIAAVWKQPNSQVFKTYLFVTCLLLLALIAVMSGAAGIDTRSFTGLMQRVLALVAFLPIAVGAHTLANRMKSTTQCSEGTAASGS